MFKAFCTALAVFAVGALVYIGWSQAALTDQAEFANKNRVVTKAFAPADTGSDYYDPEKLAEDVVSAYNSTPPVKYKAESATCVLDGRKASCLLRTKDVNIPAAVILDADGTNFVATTKE